MARVLVTGAAGFVGSAVVRRLLGAGHQVVAGVRRPPAWPIPAGVVPVGLDVLSAEDFAAAVRHCDALVHCAVGPPRDTRVIVEGTAQALRAAREGELRRFVQISSVAVYGDVAGTIDETAPTAAPAGRYGEAKREAERLCHEQRGDMALAILRPTLVYGPGDTPWTLDYLDRILRGTWGRLGARGEGDCNLVHVDDLAGCVAHCLTAPLEAAATININGAEIPTWNRYLEGLAAAVGARLDPGFRLPGRGLLLLRKAAKALGLFDGFVTRTPSADEVARFARPVRYATAAMEAAGYRAAIDLAPALAEIAAWHRAGRPALGWGGREVPGEPQA